MHLSALEGFKDIAFNTDIFNNNCLRIPNFCEDKFKMSRIFQEIIKKTTRK